MFERQDSSSLNLIYLNPTFHTLNNTIEKPQYEESTFQLIQQSYRCLKNEGHLVLFSDLNSSSIFLSLLELVFIKESFRTQIILPHDARGRSNMPFGNSFNLLFLYSKSEGASLNKIIDIKKRDYQKKLYSKEDNRGAFIPLNPFSSNLRSNNLYKWNGYTPPKGMAWRYTKERMDKYEENGMIYYADGKPNPFIKRYFDDMQSPAISQIWDDIPLVDYSKSRISPSAQSLELTGRIISLTTKEGDSIFVPFARSGEMLISASKSSRNWIACAKPDEYKEGLEKRLAKSGIAFSIGRLGESIKFNQYQSLYRSIEDIMIVQIKYGENQGVEFKPSCKWNFELEKVEKGLINKIIREVAGFLNSKDGGRLYIGVSDSGDILNLERDFSVVNSQKEDSDSYSLFLTDKLRENLGPMVGKYIEITFPILNGKQICVIDIESSKEPIFFKGDFIVRVGSQAVSYTAEETYFYISKGRKE